MKIFGKEFTFNDYEVYHAGNKPTVSEIGAATSSHTHNYAGSSSAGGAATSALTCTGNSATATKATQDSAGQQINTTYIKGLSVSGRTITYTKGDGTTGTITTQDTNTTYSTGTATTSGLTKLYTGTGTATDGTMTQAAINTALSGKAASSHTHNYAGSSSAGGAATSALACTGNSATATKLATARTINGVSFDGSANITITAAANGGTSAACSGNSATATVLQTARTINGTSFNGSANITTANWGTARTITIGSTGKSVNGSGNVTWTLSEIGAAPASHSHASVVMNNCSNKDLNTIKTAGFYYGYTGMTNAPVQSIAVLEVLVYSPDWIVQRFTVVGDGGRKYERHFHNGTTWSTWRTLYDSSNKPTPSDIGAAASSHTHNYAGSSSAGGAANSATKLATARSINGTNFDGTGNITTANWGTARTITIGNTGKSVNGAGNISWSLSEIGAAAASHTHAYAPTSTGSSISIHADSDSSSTSEYLLLKAGHNELKIASSAGGTTVTKGQDKLTFNGNVVYHTGKKPTASEIGAAASSHTHNYAGSSSAGGAANSANTLATARTINGTSFNGSANITTANWGTARTLTIGNTGKSVNGSGNVSWSLSEIGAAAASHTHSYLPLSGGTISGCIYDNRITTGNKQLINATSNRVCVGNSSSLLSLEASQIPAVLIGSQNYQLLTDISSQMVVKGKDTVVRAGDNWNNFENSGVYVVSIDGAWGANCPTNSYQWGLLLVIRAENVVTQIYFPHADHTYFQYRVRYIGSWSNWINIGGWGYFSDNEISTLEESGAQSIMEQLEEQKEINKELYEKIRMLESKLT